MEKQGKQLGKHGETMCETGETRGINTGNWRNNQEVNESAI